MLEKRREATEGARESAAAMLKQASEKAGMLEAALRKARDEIYQENEETRRRWIGEQASRLEEARRESRELIHKAKQELEAEAAAGQAIVSGDGGDSGGRNHAVVAGKEERRERPALPRWRSTA